MGKNLLKTLTKRAKIVLGLCLTLLATAVLGIGLGVGLNNSPVATVSKGTVTGGSVSGDKLQEVTVNKDGTVSGADTWQDVDIEFNEDSDQVDVDFTITNNDPDSQVVIDPTSVSGELTDVEYKIFLNGKEVTSATVSSSGTIVTTDDTYLPTTDTIKAEVKITFTKTDASGNSTTCKFTFPFTFKPTLEPTEPGDYTITTNAIDCTISGDTVINKDSSITLTIIPNEGYLLPFGLIVIGAEYQYNQETGALTLSSATENVQISVAAVTDPPSYESIDQAKADGWRLLDSTDVDKVFGVDLVPYVFADTSATPNTVSTITDLCTLVPTGENKFPELDNLKVFTTYSTYGSTGIIMVGFNLHIYNFTNNVNMMSSAEDMTGYYYLAGYSVIMMFADILGLGFEETFKLIQEQSSDYTREDMLTYHQYKVGSFNSSINWNNWLYVKDIEPEVTTISFTIDGTSYQTEEGMTWAQWVESSYNTAGYSQDGNGRIDPNTDGLSEQYMVCLEGFGGSAVSPTDIITENMEYYHSPYLGSKQEPEPPN